MAENGIRTVLCAASVDFLKDEKLYREAYWKVTEARRQKADRFIFAKDKRLCIGAELLLRETLIRAGAGPIEPVTEEGTYGKPTLKDHPEIRFNLSHSGEMVLCAVSDRKVGCDIEEVARTNLNLMERFFYREEYEKIMNAGSPEEQTDMFYRLWTLKESFMKMKGLGLHLAPETFGIRMGEDGPRLIDSANGPDTCCFREYDMIPGYKCAMCIENYEDDVRLERIGIRD